MRSYEVNKGENCVMDTIEPDFWLSWVHCKCKSSKIIMLMNARYTILVDRLHFNYTSS